MQDKFQRIERLPPYTFNVVGDLKKAARARGEDIVDMSMGNPDQPTPKHIIDKLKEIQVKLNRDHSPEGEDDRRETEATDLERGFLAAQEQQLKDLTAQLQASVASGAEKAVLKLEELIKTLDEDGLLKVRVKSDVDSEPHFAVLVALKKLYQKCG